MKPVNKEGETIGGGRPHLLILTAGFGEGHNAAARGLAAACDELHGEGSAEVLDLFLLTSPRTSALVRSGYIGLINRLPRLWRGIYGLMDRSALLPRLLSSSLRPQVRFLARRFEAGCPRAICSTYPVYPFLLERLREQGRLPVPHYTVVTDSISIHSLWWRSPCDGWFVPNADSAAVMEGRGVNPQRLNVSGFPVTPYFRRHAGEFTRPDLGSGATPRVLHIINSGTRHAAATAERLLSGSEFEVTCAVGRNEKLRKRLERVAAGRSKPSRILGWTDEIPRLLMTHHVVVSKAGGATTQEAIAAECPMIVSQVVPGQEEGNCELVLRHGAGNLAESTEAVIAALRQAFAQRGALWRRWHAAMAPLSRPDAARVIVRTVLQAGEAAP